MPVFTKDDVTPQYDCKADAKVNVAIGGNFGGGSFALQYFNGKVWLPLYEGAAPAAYTAPVNKVLDLGPLRIKGVFTGSTAPDLTWIINGPNKYGD